MDDAIGEQATEEVVGHSEIRVGISTCLLGQEVRFDGGHKRDPFVTNQLAQYVRFVPVCPEVELGLGTPREAIRLVDRKDGEGTRLVGTRSGKDITDAMRAYSDDRVSGLAEYDLGGYILKKDSPSCGLFRVRRYNDKDIPERNGRGLFAEALCAANPLLPVEEEGRLHDPRLRENFIERLFAYRRLKDLFESDWTVRDLMAFHAREKMLLTAHDPRSARDLGRLAARAKDMPPEEVADGYAHGFMEAMGRIATARKHTNVLQHLAGHFKKKLDRAGRGELASVIEDFHRGLVPLVVPITLIRHYVRLFDDAYLAGQTYLAPHPKELMLRNHC